MSGEVLFQMDSYLRKSLIECHRFYVEQARKRLLSQFKNMEEEARKAAEDWLDRSSRNFDPDRHDPADFYEAANEHQIEFYNLLSDMRDQTWLGVVAGMFHEWDKQLREWLARETHHWWIGQNFPRKIWSADFVQIRDLLQCIGWNLGETDYIRTLDACRLVVNVYKHGEGKSFDDLKENYPEYIRYPLGDSEYKFMEMDFRDHSHLNVTEEQFVSFSEAIVDFWKAVPGNILQSEIGDFPSCFEKAITQDIIEQKKPKNKES